MPMIMRSVGSWWGAESRFREHCESTLFHIWITGNCSKLEQCVCVYQIIEDRESIFNSIGLTTCETHGDQVPQGHFRGTREAAPAQQENWFNFDDKNYLFGFRLGAILTFGRDIFCSIALCDCIWKNIDLVVLKNMGFRVFKNNVMEQRTIDIPQNGESGSRNLRSGSRRWLNLLC